MDLKLARAAVDAYKEDASDATSARLDFFMGLWEVQEEIAERIKDSYEVPSAEDANEWYWLDEPLLVHAPVVLDADAFAADCKAIADYMVEHAELDEAAATALSAYDWLAFCQKADLELAGSNPPQFIENCLQDIESLDVPSELPATIFMMVPYMALRPYLQQAEQAIMELVSFKDIKHQHDQPLVCPVCGTPATAGFVGNVTGAEGQSRQQYCGACGLMWPFERIRCGNCGTQNSNHLHYFHIEGDSAHRLLNCQECGSYQRVVFQEDLKTPFCMEVEDVVMARLDAVAQDPRFAQEAVHERHD